jgi:hypothetical protein
MPHTQTPAANTSITRPSQWAIVVGLTLTVLLFRVTAWQSPSSYIVIPPPVATPLNALGAFFLACGVWAWGRRPTGLTTVFLAYGVGMGVHWGGSIGTGSERLDIALLSLYTAATALADGAFLELSLSVPRGASPRGLRRTAFYIPAMLTLLCTPILPFLPRAIGGSAIGVVIGLSFLMSIAAGVTFVVQWLRATAAERRTRHLTLVVGAIVLAGSVDLLSDSGILPGEPGFWKLTYGAVPMALAWALTRRRST